MITVVLVLARAVHIGSAMLLVALPFFLLVTLRPAWTGASHGGPAFRATMIKGLWFALVLEALSGMVWFWFVTAQMSDQSPWGILDATDLGTVLWQTQFGQLWLGRAALGLLLGVMLGLLSREKGRSFTPPLGWLFLVFSAGLLATLAWAGHAASGVRWQPWHVSVDVVHLLAGAVWPVGLVPLAIFLAPTKSRVAALGAADCAVVQRFSQASFAAVLVLVATGVANSWLMLSSWGALVTSAYGRLLVAKVLVVAVMIGLGAINRYRFLPALHVGAAPRLARTVAAESVLAVVVLLIVGLMGMTPPG
jgi:putative copper export protein